MLTNLKTTHFSSLNQTNKIRRMACKAVSSNQSSKQRRDSIVSNSEEFNFLAKQLLNGKNMSDGWCPSHQQLQRRNQGRKRHRFVHFSSKREEECVICLPPSLNDENGDDEMSDDGEMKSSLWYTSKEIGQFKMEIKEIVAFGGLDFLRIDETTFTRRGLESYSPQRKRRRRHAIQCMLRSIQNGCFDAEQTSYIARYSSERDKQIGNLQAFYDFQEVYGNNITGHQTVMPQHNQLVINEVHGKRIILQHQSKSTPTDTHGSTKFRTVF